VLNLVTKQCRGKAVATRVALCHHMQEIAFGSGPTIEQAGQLIFGEEANS